MNPNSNLLRYWVLTLIVGIVVAISAHYVIQSGVLDAVFIDENTATEIQDETVSNGNLKAENQESNLINQKFIGSVGKWTANFFLTLDFKEKTIYGTYSYPNRPGVTYTLNGKILEKGIELTEYTGDKITAHCTLKSIDDSCFSGTMNNTDGRKLKMNFCRK